MAGNSVVTERAPCGLLCTKCESFIAKICRGCYTENLKRKDKCTIVDGDPIEESENLLQCLNAKGYEQCDACPEMEGCEIYEALLLWCPYKKPVFDLTPGFGYLVKEKKPELGFKIFSDLVRHGANGILISRQYPKNLQIRTGRGTIKMYWLTSLEGEGNIQPTNLGILSDIIIRFIENNEDTVVILDGLELLITQNDFSNALRMVNHIIEVVMQQDTRFIITLDERTLDPKELALLERNMEIVER